MFNSLVTMKGGTVKIVDGSAYEVIGTGTVNVESSPRGGGE